MTARLLSLAWRYGRGPPAAVALLSSAMLMLSACGEEPTAPRGAAPEADSTARYQDTAAVDRPAATPIKAAVNLAPRPTEPLPDDASCITPACHVNFLSAKQVHGPVSVSRCDVCHEPDAGNHTYPLKRPGNDTCTFCHAQNAERHDHKAVTNSGCVACHDPHASDTKFLLTRNSVERLCADCHEMSYRNHMHGPFAAGQCTLCHQPHQSDNAMLLRGGAGPAHCLSCHSDLQQELAGAPSVHDPAVNDCSACHDAHSSDFPHQLVAAPAQTCLSCHEELAAQVKQASVAHDAVFTGEACAHCHDPHTATRPELLRDRGDKLCMTCHNTAVTASDGRTIASMAGALNRKFLHGPVRSGDCAACHNVHGSSQTALLRQMFPETFYASFDLANYALCFRCHEQALVLEETTAALTDFRDGERNLHYLHVHRQEKGRTCKTCHAIHGSDLPRHMASDVPFEGSQWAMPIKFQTTDDGGSCAPGCHEPMSYDRTPVESNQAGEEVERGEP